MIRKILKADMTGIRHVSQVILQGGIAAFPTETFYGLGADAEMKKLCRKFSDQGSGRKQASPSFDRRPGVAYRACPVHSSRCRTINGKILARPLTLVFEASPLLSSLLTGGTGTVGVRLSPHPIAQALVRAVGRAITATSANFSGQPSASVAAEVFRAMGTRVDAILDGGQTKGGLGSTVLDVSSPAPRIIRQGVISRPELVPFLGV